MLQRIVAASAHNPGLVGFAALAFTAWGLWAVYQTPLDAIPDLSDVQVIVYTEFPGQAPQVVEDQVTYPIYDQDALAVPLRQAWFARLLVFWTSLSST